MGDCLRTGFGFLPVMVAVADEVRRRGVTQLLGEEFGQYLGLPDIGIILRLITGGIVVDVRRHIAVLLPDASEEPLSAVPDGGQLQRFQRRDAFCCLVQKCLVGFFRIAVLLDDPTGETGHGSVTAAFRDDRVAVVLAVRHAIVEGVLLQKLSQVHAARIQSDICRAGSEEEAGGVKRLGVEVREDGIDQLLHIAVEGGVGHIVNGKQNMELGSGRLSVFLPHIEAAVVDGEGHAGESLHDVLRRLPTGWVFGVVVITVHRQAVAADEVIAVAVIIPVFRAHIVVTDAVLQTGLVQNDVLVRIGAVTGVASDVGAIDCEHQSYTSCDSSSSTLVMNFKARIVVSSSQSPPRNTSKPLQPYLST